LFKALKGSSIPVLDIRELKKEIDEICGGAPAKPKINKDKVVAIVKWVDGTVLDSVFQVTLRP
jgi:citrate lyase subunit alpha/citrate CoA-transferase